MSALSSVHSSPAVDVVPSSVPEVQATIVNNAGSKILEPLSSPLSSPVENLISLPAHSAPPEDVSEPLHCAEQDRMQDIDESKLSEVERASDSHQPLSSMLSDVPALEHSGSMSPPGNASPTTPNGLDRDTHDVAMVVDPQGKEGKSLEKSVVLRKSHFRAHVVLFLIQIIFSTSNSAGCFLFASLALFCPTQHGSCSKTQ
jgi:hypothetical protein